MSTTIVHTGLVAGRSLRALARQPMYLTLTLAQPLVWLLLFGALFRNVVELPGFASDNYMTYLTPGVMAMTAMFAATWAGTDFVVAMDRGVMDRDLTSPMRRSALILGSVTYQASTFVVQALIMLAVGMAAGARFDAGPLGVVVALIVAVLLGSVFAALSDAVALLVRSQEALIGVSQFITLPLTFLSSVMMPGALMPDWVGNVARFNPVDWAAVAAREALAASPDWGLIGSRVVLLALLAAVMTWLATVAFRAYRRSV